MRTFLGLWENTNIYFNFSKLQSERSLNFKYIFFPTRIISEYRRLYLKNIYYLHLMPSIGSCNRFKNKKIYMFQTLEIP